MDHLLKILGEYGVLGLVLVVLIYIVLNGTISFHYPRPEKKSKKD
jgi:hypothetical protein